MCAHFGCLRSWRYCNSYPEVLSRTGIVRLWRNWAGYCRLVAWAGVKTLATAVVCDGMCRAIGPRSVVLSTLGVGVSTVCGTLDLVRHATGSYFSLDDVNLGADRAALGVWMTTLGSKEWGWKVSGRRIGCITERRCV